MPAAHPQAMAPRQAGRTRTAPPATPKGWYAQPRMRRYLLFDATGLVYLLLGGLAIRVVWALGDGATRWESVLADFSHPSYLAFHAVALASVLFVGVRFFRLFPKAQPPRIGPAKPPPGSVIVAMLYAVWIGVTVAMVAVLGGWVL